MGLELGYTQKENLQTVLFNICTASGDGGIQSLGAGTEGHGTWNVKEMGTWPGGSSSLRF